MEQIEDKKQFAVLIDSDNISAKYAASIFNEIENYGYASFRRIYGNWSGKSNGWKEQVLLENSITPVQQFSYTTGKTPLIWPWSSTPWIFCIRERWTASAW